MQDYSKMPTPMPEDGEVEANEEEPGAEGGKENMATTGKDALGDTAKLKAWFMS